MKRLGSCLHCVRTVIVHLKPSAPSLRAAPDGGHVILPGRVLIRSGTTRGRDWWTSGWQPEVLKDLRRHLLLGDERDHDAAAAARANEHVFSEDAQQEFGPGDARIGTARRHGLGLRRLFARVGRLTRSGRFRFRHDTAAPLGRGSEDSVEANEVSARWWYKRRQPAEKLARQKDENLRSVGQRALQAITEAAVGQTGETILRERRPGSIAAQMQKAFTVVGVQVYASVQRETLEVRGLLPASAPLGRLAAERRHRVCLSGSQRVRARPIRRAASTRGRNSLRTRRKIRPRTCATSASDGAGSATKRIAPSASTNTPSGITQWECTFRLSAPPNRCTN